MANPVTLVTLAALSIVGAALGLHLGQSAIGDINPAYFGDPEADSFHADLVPYRAPALATAGLGLARGDVPITSCIGCRAYPEEYRPVHDPSVDGFDDGWSAGASATKAAEPIHAAEPGWTEAAPDPDREAMVRYATYSVAQPAEALSLEEAAAPETGAAGDTQ